MIQVNRHHFHQTEARPAAAAASEELQRAEAEFKVREEELARVKQQVESKEGGKHSQRVTGCWMRFA